MKVDITNFHYILNDFEHIMHEVFFLNVTYLQRLPTFSEFLLTLLFLYLFYLRYFHPMVLPLWYVDRLPLSAII